MVLKSRLLFPPRRESRCGLLVHVRTCVLRMFYIVLFVRFLFKYDNVLYTVHVNM